MSIFKPCTDCTGILVEVWRVGAWRMFLLIFICSSLGVTDLRL